MVNVHWNNQRRGAGANGAGHRIVGVGRASRDFSNDPLTFGGVFVSAPSQPDKFWRLNELDTDIIGLMDVRQLTDSLADLSPEVSKAIWDFLRLCNPGWDIWVTRPNSDTIYKEGERRLNAFLDTLDNYYGSVDVVFNRMFLAGFLRGSFFTELVLDGGRTPVDLVTPDPFFARFRSVPHPARGRVWELGQFQRGGWVSLEYDNIGYLAIDPFPGSPYGRPLISPALFSALFLLGLLRDLRRVVAQQGYPRIDIAVQLESLLAMMPVDQRDDQEEVGKWITSAIGQVQDAYESLEPDDAYIHADFITVNRPVGAMDSQSLGAVDGLLRSIDRIVIRALKTMPLLMGSNEATSETHASRQWEIQAAGIRSLQKGAERMLSRLLTVGLQAQGLQGRVHVDFKEIRESEALRDAQTEALRIDNAVKKYNQGWISQDAASQEVVGQDAAEAEPRPQAKDQPGVVFAPGSGAQGLAGLLSPHTRGHMLGQRVKFTPDGAGDPLPELPGDATPRESMRAKARAHWDGLFADYVGMLDAEVIGATEFEEV